MYTTVLLLHSWNRWIVLLLGIVAVVGAFANISRRAPWSQGNDRAALFFMIFADIQLLLGVSLFAITPWLHMFASAPGSAMGNETVRYWTMEHGFGMIVAIAFAHVGRVSIRRKTDPLAKNRSAAIWLTLAVVIMLLTLPWPFMPYGRPLIRI